MLFPLTSVPTAAEICSQYFQFTLSFPFTHKFNDNSEEELEKL